MNTSEWHQAITDRLPPEDPNTGTLFRRIISEVEFYGAATMIARKLGLRRVPLSRGTWLHGWMLSNESPRQNYSLYYYKPHFTYLVHSRAYVEQLAAEGIHNVAAAGYPFIYSDPPENVERIKGSLLVMPAHSWEKLSREFTYAEEKYVDYILSMREFFPHIMFCVHRSCVGNGYWIRTLEKRGIPYFVGVRVNDMNSFARLRLLFGHFENVASNNIGSHIAYAAYCGCKVSIDERFVYPFKATCYITEQIRKTGIVYFQDNLIEWIRERHGWLLTPPTQARADLEWAKRELCEEDKLPPEAIAELLGWNDAAVQRRMFFRYACKAFSMNRFTGKTCEWFETRLLGGWRNLPKPPMRGL